jgi:hypothetical protein
MFRGRGGFHIGGDVPEMLLLDPRVVLHHGRGRPRLNPRARLHCGRWLGDIALLLDAILLVGADRGLHVGIILRRGNDDFVGEIVIACPVLPLDLGVVLAKRRDSARDYRGGEQGRRKLNDFFHNSCAQYNTGIM